jgi:hypothetical protein
MRLYKMPINVHKESGFSIKLIKWDEYDYVFNIKAFGRDFSIGVVK